MNFVLGSSGRLGSAIASAAESNEITRLSRAIYSDWWRENAADRVTRFFDGRANSKSIIYVASGIIDPKRSVEEHHRVNFLLPKNVIEGAAKLGMRVVTFGTIMEEVIGDTTANPYFLSKTKLGKFVSEFSARNKTALHIRIHTLYGGGLPDRFMFLGQIFHALVSKTEFHMSPGAQLREYHHIDDEVSAISKLLKGEIGGAVNLNHGEPISLRELATYIFEKFNCLELLKIGALAEPSNENYGISFQRTLPLKEMKFRETLPSLVQYLQLCKASLRKT